MIRDCNVTDFSPRAAADELFARRAWWPAAVAHLKEPVRIAVLEQAYLRRFVGDWGYGDAVARVTRANDPHDRPETRETLLMATLWSSAAKRMMLAVYLRETSALNPISHNEPPRVWRRLPALRDWEHDTTDRGGSEAD